MKRISWYYSITPIFLFIIVLFGVIGVSMLNANAQNIETDIETEPKVNAVYVSTTSINSENSFYLDLLGTVEAESEVMVYPSTSGQIIAVNVREGDRVEKGDVLFVLGGPNETDHPVLKQFQIAQTNYESAGLLYENTLNSMDIAINIAELQLESARHQTEGSYIDYQAMAKNIETAKDGIGLTRNSLSETSIKNQRDIYNMIDKIADMEEAIDDFDDTRSEALMNLMDLIAATPDEATRATLEKQLEQTKTELNQKRKELESAKKELENGVETLSSASILTENQIIGQLQQAQNQEHQLYMTKDSMQWKLGLFDGTSDPVKIAEQALSSAKAQANAAIIQAGTGLQLAEINLELAGDQKKYLLVKAPASGVVTNVTGQSGAMASPQAPVTQILNNNDFKLVVGVDSENAQNISLNADAEIFIGGRYIKVPIQSISPVADPMSKLVNITLTLPKISLRPNQTMQARIAIKPVSTGLEKSVFVPLDAVTIGTENQFVYILDGNKAKQVNVKLGEINGDIIEITSGLNGDEEIIVDGAKDVLDGQTVTIN